MQYHTKAPEDGHPLGLFCFLSIVHAQPDESMAVFYDKNERAWARVYLRKVRIMK